MAVKIIANYSKRLGLPGYSSHQFSVSVETELATTDNVNSEASRLYKTLQSAVDREMPGRGIFEWSWAVGIRNSLDKTFPAGLVAGTKVFCCDNLVRRAA